MSIKTFDFKWFGLLFPLLIACGLSNTPDINATVAAGIGGTQTAQANISRPTDFPTPSTFAYATPIPYSGTGPFTIPAQNSVLLKIYPNNSTENISFVKSLTLHVQITDPVVQEASTLDFMFWSPSSGGWRANGGRNKLAWGEEDINIEYPDALVSRQGEIVIDIRNWGSIDQSIQAFSVTLVVLTTTGEEITY